jgi:hypothetical protein
MSDDIVTRLREGCVECGLHTLYACTNEAADEIERLRAVRDYWHERCNNAEECLQFLNRKKKWWKL